MKKSILAAAVVLAFTLAVGTVYAAALPEKEVDAVSSATQSTASRGNTAQDNFPARKNPLTEKEQARLAELLAAEQAVEQEEDAVKESFHSGGLSLKEYLTRKAELEAQEDALELELDALEDKLDAQHEGKDDHDDDCDDD